MYKKISVGISNRHVHLTEEIYSQIFSCPLRKKNDLNQVGEFASFQVVTLKTEKGQIENVRVVGPFRKYNQVEISRRDARYLGINPPVRGSGDLKESEDITIIGDLGEVKLKESCILASRHVHMSKSLAQELGVTDNQQVKIKVEGDKSCLLDAFIKVTENGYFELHLDTDDANAIGVENGDEVDLIL